MVVVVVTQYIREQHILAVVPRPEPRSPLSRTTDCAGVFVLTTEKAI